MTPEPRSLPLSPAPPSAAGQRLLEERAVVLARPAPETARGQSVEFVEFSLAGERYGFESACLREVCALKELTPLPCAPACVAGILNVRGEILAVIDLRVLFELPAAGPVEGAKILIVEAAGARAGFLADALHGVRRAPAAELQPAPATFTGVRTDFLRGITRERVAVLAAGRILQDERLSGGEAAAPAGEIPRLT